MVKTFIISRYIVKNVPVHLKNVGVGMIDDLERAALRRFFLAKLTKL